MNEDKPIEQRKPNPTDKKEPSSSRIPEDPINITVALVTEISEQRLAFQHQIELAASERKAERRWKLAFQGLFFGAPLLLGLVYFLFFLSSTGFRWGPWNDVVGIVRIEGEIKPNAMASANKIIPALEKAFMATNVKAVVLSIESPGGAPVESERISNSIASLKKKYPKPVIAVINNLGASAAYMIALHADKIIAGKYSLVGSIGAIMAPWDLSKAIGKLEVSQRVYASGKLKAFLNPFTAPTADGEVKAMRLVNQMGGNFVDELRTFRGKSLKKGVDYSTGEVWGGIEAKSLGLIDEIGTLDSVADVNWGLKTYDFGPYPEGLGILSSSLHGSVASFFENWLTSRAMHLR